MISILPSDLAIKIKKKQIPLSRGLMFTAKCNLRCIHCYNYLPKDEDLTTRNLKKQIDQLANRGCLFLTITGGEPLMRKDFWEIAEYAQEKSFALILVTNGSLINDQVAEKIKRLNFFEVRVTLLGATEKFHDTITKTKGSFRKTIAGVKLLKKKKVNVNVATTVISQNRFQIEKIKALANKLGVNHRFYFVGYPTDEGCLIKGD